MTDTAPRSDPGQHPATIDDVARRAGVSTATVSRALRDHPNVTSATRRKVEDAAAALRYVANPNASRLASGRSGTVGVLAPILTSWYTSEVLAGVEEVLAEEHMDLLIGTASTPLRDRVLRGDAAFRQRVDGVLLVDVFCAESGAEALAAQALPVIVLGEQLRAVTSLSVDNFTGAALAAEYLLALGHRDIAIITGGADPLIATSVPAQRSGGFLAALERAGVRPADRWRIDGGFSIDGGRLAAHELLSLRHPPTAVFCLSDEMAFGVLQAARERGVGVPAQLSVIGFDDHSVSAAFGLTTVRQPVRRMGRDAARLMVEALREPAPAKHHAVAVDLVERVSTAPPTA